MKKIFSTINTEEYKIDILQNFFNAINDGHFDHHLRAIAEKKSFGDEYRYCTFANDIDPEEDEPFKGIKIQLVNETVIYSEDEFSKILYEACKKYIEINPDSKESIEKLFSELRGRLWWTL